MDRVSGLGSKKKLSRLLGNVPLRMWYWSSDSNAREPAVRKSGRRNPQCKGPEAEQARHAQSTEGGGASVSESVVTDEAGETSEVSQ